MLQHYLRDLRRRKKVTLKEVAADTGVSYSYLSALERGARDRPGWDKLSILAQYYGVHLEDLTDVARADRRTNERLEKGLAALGGDVGFRERERNTRRKIESVSGAVEALAGRSVNPRLPTRRDQHYYLSFHREQNENSPPYSLDPLLRRLERDQIIASLTELDDRDAAEAFTISVGDDSHMFFKSDLAPNRKRSSLAHELAHCLGIDLETDAWDFARKLLVPAEDLAEDFEMVGFNFPVLCDIYEISPEMITQQLANVPSVPKCSIVFASRKLGEPESRPTVGLIKNIHRFQRNWFKGRMAGRDFVPRNTALHRVFKTGESARKALTLRDTEFQYFAVAMPFFYSEDEDRTVIWRAISIAFDRPTVETLVESGEWESLALALGPAPTPDELDWASD